MTEQEKPRQLLLAEDSKSLDLMVKNKIESRLARFTLRPTPTSISWGRRAKTT